MKGILSNTAWKLKGKKLEMKKKVKILQHISRTQKWDATTHKCFLPNSLDFSAVLELRDWIHTVRSSETTLAYFQKWEQLLRESKQRPKFFGKERTNLMSLHVVNHLNEAERGQMEPLRIVMNLQRCQRSHSRMTCANAFSFFSLITAALEKQYLALSSDYDAGVGQNVFRTDSAKKRNLMLKNTSLWKILGNLCKEFSCKHHENKRFNLFFCRFEKKATPFWTFRTHEWFFAADKTTQACAGEDRREKLMRKSWHTYPANPTPRPANLWRFSEETNNNCPSMGSGVINRCFVRDTWTFSFMARSNGILAF